MTHDNASNLVLRLADCRQALFDANRIGDEGALTAEVERAFCLMGEAIDALRPPMPPKSPPGFDKPHPASGGRVA